MDSRVVCEGLLGIGHGTTGSERAPGPPAIEPAPSEGAASSKTLILVALACMVLGGVGAVVLMNLLGK